MSACPRCRIDRSNVDPHSIALLLWHGCTSKAIWSNHEWMERGSINQQKRKKFKHLGALRKSQGAFGLLSAPLQETMRKYGKYNTTMVVVYVPHPQNKDEPFFGDRFWHFDLFLWMAISTRSLSLLAGFDTLNDSSEMATSIYPFNFFSPISNLLPFTWDQLVSPTHVH